MLEIVGERLLSVNLLSFKIKIAKFKTMEVIMELC